MIKILFLCHGNICRSPMAEFVMKELVRRAGRTDVLVESAALHTDEIGNDIHRGTREKLREMGIPFEPRAAWLLNAAKAREYDYLVGMDAYNIADLRRLVYPEDLPKIHKLLDFAGKPRDIADPWYTGDFDATYDDILEGCTAMLTATLVGREFVHFKGGHYRLSGFAKDSETLETMVVYEALYGEGGLWVRPAKMFFERVDKPGYSGPRFKLVAT